MSQGFKLRFDQMRESDPTSDEIASGNEAHESYPTPSYTRNLCLAWPDGRRMFLNYAYLVMAEFDPNSEVNVIKLSFSSQIVVLKGYSLEMLFMALLDHLPRQIMAIDPRYILEENKSHFILMEIIVEKNEE